MPMVEGGNSKDVDGMSIDFFRHGARRSSQTQALSLPRHQHHPSYGTNDSVSRREVGSEIFPEARLPNAEHDLDSGSRSPHRILGAAGALVLFGLGIGAMTSPLAPESWRQATSSTMSAAQTTTKPLGNPSFDVPGVPTLKLRATNEYGEFDRAALHLYGLEMLVEPFRETTISVHEHGTSTDVADDTVEHPRMSHGRMALVHRPRRVIGDGSTAYVWRIVEADENGNPRNDTQQSNPFVGESSVTVTLPLAGGVYVVMVEKRNADGSLAAVGRAVASCKYVRREIRDLTLSDRVELFSAMQKYYTISPEEGRAKYGPLFNNYQLPTAYHNAARSVYCYHAGMQFLTAHAAFTRMMETSLQMINPRVSVPSWDFMVDAHEFGSEWHHSPIFGSEMFGASVTSLEDNFQVSDGWFSNVSSIFDPTNKVVKQRFLVNHSPFGYINALYNYQNLPRLTRTSSYCGLKSEMRFATSDTFLGCFEDNHNISDWETCMESQVHGNMHGLLGGAFDCNVNFGAFQEEHPEYSTGLLTFLLEYMTTNYWPDNSFMGDYNRCDTSCDKDSPERCGCTCLIDADSISENEVYKLVLSFLRKSSGRYGGSSYISYDDDARFPWGFKQDGKRMGHESSMLLMRKLVKLGCEPSAVGYMSGGASPMDPIFWVLHQIFEKALHILWMSPKWRDSYSFDWVNGTCQGSGLDDELPFSEQDLGMGDGESFLTNRQIMDLIHPANPKVPYVYNKFNAWGNMTDWDPCVECSSTAHNEVIP